MCASSSTKDEDGRDKLGFEFLDGPVTPKPEKLPAVRPKAKRRSSPRPQGQARLGAEGAADQGLKLAVSKRQQPKAGPSRPAFAFRRCRMRAPAVARAAAL